MEKIYENIINEGKKNGKTVETINAELKEAGANFHLNPDGGVANGNGRGLHSCGEGAGGREAPA